MVIISVSGLGTEWIHLSLETEQEGKGSTQRLHWQWKGKQEKVGESVRYRGMEG